jgi:hypothetical protein
MKTVTHSNGKIQVWSERLGKNIEVDTQQNSNCVDELLRTGVGTRMLVPDWDPESKNKVKTCS